MKANIAANFSSQVYAAAIAIFTLPLYLKYMGAEAYGLVAFFATTQAWFQLLDLGLSPTLSRQVARFRGGAISATDLNTFAKMILTISLALSGIGVVAVSALSDAIAENWLKVKDLEKEIVTTSIMLMAPTLGIRFISSVLKSAIMGFERIVWLSGLNTIIATLRYILVLPLIVYFSSDPRIFFSYHIVVAIVELVSLLVALQSLTRKPGISTPSRLARDIYLPELKFALSVSVTGIIWIFATQFDKLLLSKILPLDQYGYFMLCASAANGILIVSGPIGAVVVPRLTKLHAESNDNEVVRLYRMTSQIAIIATAPLVLLMSTFSQEILTVWTGNENVADIAHRTLALYTIGNAFLVAASFQYYIQIAHGNVRLHLIINTAFIVILIPCLYYFTGRYGMVGAGYVWMLANASLFVLWTPVVHARFLPNIHLAWLTRDVLAIYVPTAITASVASYLIAWPTSRSVGALMLALIALVLLFVASLSSSQCRKFLWVRLKAHS
jgi:O-antigen/teichoic acid export membrane protein